MHVMTSHGFGTTEVSVAQCKGPFDPQNGWDKTVQCIGEEAAFVLVLTWP